ncbi:hypothetical protein [Paenibacillus alginolyticus]|uniref:Sugar phosphate isomerase/epimerase n=1 Tax=Paenibacillus alginolyticus TaxID=59839 RepID=A0ABT4GLM6_9BACL|nr:hypothetical protein [Paenibacillus alginolyticus]MCY9697092.1 hypothetical protein [Paenibacillus alginolyticus]MEC0146278.1 hypothetical protein [Paenibacillus alginolyticus]
MSRFRLGILTDEVSQDLREAIAFAQQFGLQALELRSVDNRLLHQMEEEAIEGIRLMVDQSGLSICGLSAPIFKCELDQNRYRAAVHSHCTAIKRIAHSRIQFLGKSCVRGGAAEDCLAD